MQQLEQLENMAPFQKRMNSLTCQSSNVVLDMRNQSTKDDGTERDGEQEIEPPLKRLRHERSSRDTVVAAVDCEGVPENLF